MNRGFSNYQTLTGQEAAAGAPNRSIPDRIKAYHLLDYLKPNARVLDIGCNRGYFGVALSSHVLTYVGIDHDAGQLAYGLKMVREHQLRNVELYAKSFEQFLMPDGAFDCILSLAVHSYSKFHMSDYASKIYRGLAPGGIVVLEGHPKGYRGEPTKLNCLVKLFEEYFKMKRLFHTQVRDRANMRDVYIWQR